MVAHAIEHGERGDAAAGTKFATLDKIAAYQNYSIGDVCLMPKIAILSCIFSNLKGFHHEVERPLSSLLLHRCIELSCLMIQTNSCASGMAHRVKAKAGGCI